VVADGAAGDIGGLTIEQWQQDVEVLGHVPDWPVEGHAEHALDHRLVHHADAEGEPAADQLVRR